MYLQEPTTPLRPPKKRRQKNTVDTDDAKVAEFLALSQYSDNLFTNPSERQEPIGDPIQESVESRIEKWLVEKGITRSSPEDVKHLYYDSCRSRLAHTLNDLDSVDSWGTSIKKKPAMGFCFSQSKIAQRRSNPFDLELESPKLALKSSSLRLDLEAGHSNSLPNSHMQYTQKKSIHAPKGAEGELFDL